MKKITLLFFAGLLSLCCNAQNIIQISNDGNRNNYSNKQQECEFRINGICSLEDIGGVDFEEVKGVNEYGQVKKDIKATNYNSFAVTVLFKIEYGRSSSYGIEKEKVITKVLKPNETKYLDLSGPLSWGYYLTYSITRRMGN